MKKNIVLMYILSLGMLIHTVAIAAPKEKVSKKSEKTAAKDKKSKKASVKAEKKQKTQDKKKHKQDKKKQLQQEMKEWEQKKKNMKPLQLKDLVEENHQLRTKNGEMKLTVEELQKKLKETTAGGDERNTTHAHSEAEYQKLVELQKQIQTSLASRDLSELPEGSYTINKETGEVLIGGLVDPRYGVHNATGLPFLRGTIFKVQIGAKHDLDLKDILIDEVNHETLAQEVSEGLYKYTIGHFRNYWEADKLKQGLRSMGIQLAWIVPYKDGNRVLLKEVLPEVMDK